MNLGWLEWVVGGKVDVQEEDSALVRRVRGSHDCSLPIEEVIANGAGRAIGGWVRAQVLI